HELGNVEQQSRALGVRYPVALDNDYATWDAYRNQAWPAEYLIDARGRLREYHYGEGEYDRTEHLIRTLLAERRRRLPRQLDLRDRTPTGPLTPESYLGFDRLRPEIAARIRPGVMTQYRLPRGVQLDELAYGGFWRVEHQRAVAGLGAQLELHFQARKVHLVLGGHGTVEVV